MSKMPAQPSDKVRNVKNERRARKDDAARATAVNSDERMVNSVGSTETSGRSLEEVAEVANHAMRTNPMPVRVELPSIP